MQDRELYEQILGLNSPWSVASVELKAADSEVHIHVDHPRGTRVLLSQLQAKIGLL